MGSSFNSGGPASPFSEGLGPRLGQLGEWVGAGERIPRRADQGGCPVVRSWFMAASVRVRINPGPAMGSEALAKFPPLLSLSFPPETADLGLDPCDASSRLLGNGMLCPVPRAWPGTQYHADT